MFIDYTRSSSYNRWDWCQLCYLVEYVLGHRNKTNKSAEAGNIIHKCMECLALLKKGHQDGNDIIEVPGIGTLDFNNISYDSIFDSSYHYYVDKSENEYTDKDYKKYREWLTKATEDYDGRYNPLNIKIYDAEKSFDVPIMKDWAVYKQTIGPNTFEGRFSVKGNVDLIAEYKPGVLELTDYKTGARKDWNKDTDEPKGYFDFLDDPQLKIYYYALCHTYPKHEILMTIYYINSGGPFTMPFDRSILPEIEEMLRKRFEEIKKNTNPKPLSYSRKHFKCKSMCKFSKDVFKDDKCTCEFIRDEIKDKGLDHVIQNHTAENFNPTVYGDGGGKTGLVL